MTRCDAVKDVFYDALNVLLRVRATRLATERLADPDVSRAYQNCLPESLSKFLPSESNSYWDKIATSLHCTGNVTCGAAPPGSLKHWIADQTVAPHQSPGNVHVDLDHKLMRRCTRRQVKVVVQVDRDEGGHRKTKKWKRPRKQVLHEDYFSCSVRPAPETTCERNHQGSEWSKHLEQRRTPRPPDHEPLHADRLCQKGSKRTLGLLVTIFSSSAVQKILGRAVSNQKANPTIRRLSRDCPLEARKLGHSSSRREVRKRLLDGASSADPKLKAELIVLIAPCAPESTPRITTATPDSSFHPTTADPSNSKGSNALEEASFTWTERSKYVELSALLSVTDDKGATVNSTPKSQLSWIGSDERSQVAKPTGKPTTCADVDIRECCENRTTTETVKLPISSSTPSKVASDCGHTCPQDLDSQSLKPDHVEPDSPLYTQLATLIAGDSDVHICAKKTRLQPNKPYMIRQIRKPLADFKVQPSAKTSLMGAPPKELLGAATQCSKLQRDTFPVKPRQNAEEVKQTQICLNSLNNSKSGRPKGVIERATRSSGRNFRPRGKSFVRQRQKARTNRAPTGRKNTSNENQPSKPPSANLPGYTTLGSLPSEATEIVSKCLSTNCLSLFNKLCDIKQSVCLEQPSIIALIETWLTPDVSDTENSIDGYSVFRADSKRRRAGEVALYLHTALPIPIVLSDATPAPFCDALWIQVLPRGPDSLLLGVVCRSPSSPPEDDHFLIRTLGQLSSSYHFTHLLLVGDFNAPKAPWTELQCVGSSGPFAAALTEVVQQSAWTQHVVAPTRYRAGQQPSLLDLVITNERHFVDQVTINAPLGHSDHCVLTFDFICYWARNPEPQTWTTSDQIVVSEFYRDYYAGLYSVPASSSHPTLSRRIYERHLTDLVLTLEGIRQLRKINPLCGCVHMSFGGDSADSFVMRGEKEPEDIMRIDAKKDLGILLSPNMSFSLHLEKSAQKASAVLRMIRCTFSRITRTDFQILSGAYVRPLLEYAHPVVYSGRTKDVILIERVQRAATKMVAGMNSMEYETCLKNSVQNTVRPIVTRVLALASILSRAENLKNSATPFFHLCLSGERQPLNGKNKTDPGNLGESLDPVY
ncbi:hypothetical protein CLF_113039 [Clonorchis sinensis]|uniref:Endonuclease/exonuclease/phosphatase domain-containing protein n=1 Tax=Clonorchis sinensis TaxID=79923 RepID=G7YXI2_CLOSI|nr:hypothetical protein CLF_113039 [Clonorchis sinensis]